MAFLLRTASAGRRRQVLRVVGFACAALLAGGCFPSSSGSDYTTGSGGSGGSTPQPVGPVAHNANEAFPDKPANAPVISAKEILQACATEVACLYPAAGTQDQMSDIAKCVMWVQWSAERAIPMTMNYTGVYDERAEYFVTCVNQHAADCGAVGQCTTVRDSNIYCEEDGCSGPSYVQATCQGTVAMVDGHVERDCARAYAECDPSSRTGCTDRHFTACPADGNHADHCDGNVRLGCDGAGQVSYHDCSRMGGTCGTSEYGHQTCLYTEGTADPGCESGRLPSCSATTLSGCVNYRLVSVDAPEVCKGP